MAAGDVHRLRWHLLVAALMAMLAPVQAAPQAYPLPPAPGQSPAAEQTAAPVARVRTPTNGLVTIESDLQRADNKTGVITATGNVRIVYPDERVIATARQAQYFSQEGRVILSGDVDIVQEGGNALRAERVIYDVATERLLAQPTRGQQVFSKVRLPSDSTSSPVDAGADAPAKPAP
jgi:lipopolysaccharide export system protein LptA